MRRRGIRVVQRQNILLTVQRWRDNLNTDLAGLDRNLGSTRILPGNDELARHLGERGALP